MDGAKSVTDTLEFRKEYGKQAFRRSKSIPERGCESCGNEDPGESRNLAE